MNAEMTGTTKFTPQRKPYDWAGLAKKTGVVVGTSDLHICTLMIACDPFSSQIVPFTAILRLFETDDAIALVPNLFSDLTPSPWSIGTGALFGALGYGAYTTVSGQAMNNVRAMGWRVGIQFAIVAAGLSYYAVSEYGTPSEMYERYQKTGKVFSDGESAQAELAKHTHHPKSL